MRAGREAYESAQTDVGQRGTIAATIESVDTFSKPNAAHAPLAVYLFLARNNMNSKIATALRAMGPLLVPIAGHALEKNGAMSSSSRLSTAIVTLLTFVSLLAFAFLGWNAPVLGAERAETVLLVARPAMNDPLYGHSILVARELPGGQHMGFILNKPTELKLAEALPDHEPSKSVTDPLYLGGPSNLNVVFALVRGRTTPSDGTMALSENIYLAISGDAVDKAIAAGPDEHARFFVGAVVWRAGELDAEIKQGAWYVLEAKPELVLPQRTAGLWEELAQQADMAANGI
jgi:putative transcriptional regulator